MDPYNENLPYLYDTFSWDICEDEGFQFSQDYFFSDGFNASSYSSSSSSSSGTGMPGTEDMPSPNDTPNEDQSEGTSPFVEPVEAPAPMSP